MNTGMTLRRYSKRTIGVGLSICMSFLWLMGSARADRTLLMNKAKILFKIVTYDQKLPSDTVQLGIVYPASDPGDGPQAVSVFSQLQKLKVNGRSISVKDFKYSSSSDLKSKLSAGGLYGVFVLGSVPSSDVALIKRMASQKDLFSFAQDPAHVEAGLMSGVQQEGGQRRIILNMKSAIAAGRQLDGALIKICKLIK